VETRLARHYALEGRRAFNAATARRPWRPWKRTLPMSRYLGFNAATARRPWRPRKSSGPCAPRRRLQCGHGPKAVETWAGAGDRRVVLADASMRPRPEGRGDPYSPQRRSLPAVTLQCGHGPKAVETCGCGPAVGAGHHGLQCGHGPKAVETSLPVVSRCPRPRSFNAATARRPWRPYHSVGDGPSGQLASMRPRPEGRGDPSRRRPLPPVRLASMRPRPEGRGDQ